MDMVRILVADDDEQELELARRGLVSAGFSVALSLRSNETMDEVTRNPPDLLIVGFSTGTLDKLEICRRLRASRNTAELPLIVMNEPDQTMDAIRAFELGATDCIVKPINPVELILRVRKSLKPVAITSTPRVSGEVGNVTIGELSVDRRRRVVTVSGLEVHLTATEFALLAMLTSSNGHALRREQMLEEVWGDEVGADSRTLDTHIRRLRGKLGKAASLITTIHGFGYRFEFQDPH